MKIYLLISTFILLINFEKNIFILCNNFNNGIYSISSHLSDKYFSFPIKGNLLILSNSQNNFRLINFKDNIYYIESRFLKEKIGINNKNKIQFYENFQEINNNKLLWKIIKFSENQYLIQNLFNKKYIQCSHTKLICSKDIKEIKTNNYNNSKVFQNFLFKFLKLCEELNFNKEYANIINKEPIDLVIKYIDLTDNTLTRDGINQIYKDSDNEELRYSIRSILEYIPWVRKIFILMPNKQVRFLKAIDEINEKIIYIKDKDLLNYDSANIFAFTFNLHKLEKFNISKNFILILKYIIIINNCNDLNNSLSKFLKVCKIKIFCMKYEIEEIFKGNKVYH